jgi:hypothetical protein
MDKYYFKIDNIKNVKLYEGGYIRVAADIDVTLYNDLDQQVKHSSFSEVSIHRVSDKQIFDFYFDECDNEQEQWNYVYHHLDEYYNMILTEFEDAEQFLGNEIYDDILNELLK